MSADLMSRAAWFADGVQWIASLFSPRAESDPGEPPAAPAFDEFVPYEEFISDVRHRIHSNY